MATKKISEEEWASGKTAGSSAQKASAILVAFTGLGKGAINMEAIREASGLKWPYSTVKALVKAGTLEQKKLGKALYYRIKVK
jgi:hypothetical protein